MRNEYRIEGNDVYITIRKDPHLETVISVEDLPVLLESDCAIFLLSNKQYYARVVFYPYTRIKKILLHRLVMNAPKNIQVDHINRNPLDNRRSNLRFVTQAQNNQNVSLRKDSSSGYRGVSKHGDKWAVNVAVDGKLHHLGIYNTVEEAAEVASNYRAILQPYSSEASSIKNPVASKRQVYSHNKSGITGIYWSKRDLKWIVSLVVNKKQHYGGAFSNFDDAKAALEPFKQKIGYTR